MNQRIPNGYEWPAQAATPQRFAAQSPQLSFQDKAKESATDAVRKVGEFIGSHPAACLVTAVTCGVFIGWLAKRRM